MVGGVNKATYNRLDYCRQARVSPKWTEFNRRIRRTGPAKLIVLQENGQQVGRKGEQGVLTSSKILPSPFTSG